MWDNCAVMEFDRRDRCTLPSSEHHSNTDNKNENENELLQIAISAPSDSPDTGFQIATYELIIMYINTSYIY
jgi:hypothetical protein